MEISYQISWRYSTYSCSSSGSVLSGGGSIACQYGCSYSRIVSPISSACVCFNIEDNWSYGEQSVTRIINSTYDFSTITIGTVSGNWIREVSNSNWNISTTFSLVARNDTGHINSSPRVLSSLPLYLQGGCTYTIPLVINDPDNDIVRCRWAVGRECSSVCNQFSGALLDSASCTITYTANSITELKVIAIMIEDYAPASPYQLLSSVALQFIVSIVDTNQPCSTPTEFPSFTSHPSNITVLWRQPVTLTCVANETSHYYWERHNGSIPFGSVGVLNNTLTIISVQPEDAGDYRCVAYSCSSRCDNLNCSVSSHSFSNYATVTVAGKLLLLSAMPWF